MAQFTIPDWARAAAARVDLASSPHWGAQEFGSGQFSLGNGNGLGYYKPLSQFAGAAIDPVGGTYSRPDVAGAENWLTSSGQQMMEATEGQNVMRWLQDAQGNITAEPEQFSHNDDNKNWNLMLAMMMAGAGSTISGVNAANAANAANATNSSIALTGLESTQPLITQSIPQVGGAVGLTAGETAALAGAGATGYAPATNAALIESASGTAGYGASSAGAGGGAGQLSGGLLSGWDGLKQAGGSLLDYAAKNPKVVGGLIGAVAGGAEGGDEEGRQEKGCDEEGREVKVTPGQIEITGPRFGGVLVCGAIRQPS